MKYAKSTRALAIAIVAVVASIVPAHGVATDESATAEKSYPGDPTEGRRLFKLGNEAFNAGKREEAVQFFRQAYSIYQHPKIAYNEAQCLRLSDRCEEAIPVYLKYLDQSQPPDPYVYIGIGECYHQRQEIEEAKKWFNKYLQSATDDKEKKQVEQSIETGKPPSELEQSDPGKEKAKKLYAEAAALYRQSEYLAAAELFIEANDLYYSPDFLLNIGLSYFHAIEYGQAADYFNRFLEVTDVEPKAWILLGDCLYWMDDYDGARQAYQAYLDVAPDGPHSKRAFESLLYLPTGDVSGQGGQR